MSSSKQKKVHYERGSKNTKSSSSSSSHHRHHSRDSGVGSSSASDRASLGTAAPQEHNVYPDTQRLEEDQRYNLRVVQEALDAAYEKIKRLEAGNASLDAALAASNKENRALKKERNGLLKENDDLVDAIDDLNTRLKKESAPRASPPAAARNSPKRGPDSPRQQIYVEERPRSNHSDRRASAGYYERTTPPPAPQAPHNPHPNPFAPRAAAPAVTYANIPTSVAYSAPMYAVSSHGSSRHSHYDDGKYHLQPL